MTRRPPRCRKTERIAIRVTRKQKAALRARAARAGIGLSTWILTTALEQASIGELFR